MMPGLVNESGFQRTVIEMAHALGWFIAHFRPAMTAWGWRTAVSADGAGFPDLVLVRGDRIIFAELKSETGQISPAQEKWLDALMATGVEVYVWFPRDFDRIEEILR